MDRIKRFLGAFAPALLAALMAGCAACVLLRALGFDVGWLSVYAAALSAAAVVRLGGRSTVWALVSTALLVGSIGILAFTAAEGIAALLRDAVGGLDADQLLAHAAAARSMALLAALLLGAVFSLLVQGQSTAPLVLMAFLTALICALASSEALSLWLAVPGLLAAVVVFGMHAGGRREGVRPALLLPAALAVLLAVALVPGERLTWEPLENAAAQLRSIVEDYIRFTEERMAFTINEKGYNHAGLVGDSVVAMLGGPADPDDGAVMRVQTDQNLLLRGAIKRSYTGYSWVDDQPKARYLYYDFTHRGTRNQVFDASTGAANAAFQPVTASVEMLQRGTSTLFVPARLASFEMGLEDAVYYNSIGEVFLTREVQPGDSYAVETFLPLDEASLLAAASAELEKPDARFEEIQREYTQLPQGVDSRVYALAIELTKDAATPAEKAVAIQNYLMESYAYTLDGGYPDAGEDFVSWFLLEEKKGYCSYFASAMAVLCRINGIPARYVEGYFVSAEEDGETIVTGRNAHAWVEVYLNGLGWTPFDPTARAVENQRGSDEGSMQSYVHENNGGAETPFENDGVTDDAPTPTPSPDIGSSPTATPEPELGDDNDSNNGNDNNDNNDDNDDSLPDGNQPDNQPEPDQLPDSLPDSQQSRAWLWILLALLLMLALAVLGSLWVRRRLRESDPLKLCVATRSGQAAALILYRGNLTLLAQCGLVPQNGETPAAFAERVNQSMPNPAYRQFVQEVAQSRYSGRQLTRETLEAGRRAYVGFLNDMRPTERLRYHLRRLLHGFGDLENIP